MTEQTITVSITSLDPSALYSGRGILEFFDAINREAGKRGIAHGVLADGMEQMRRIKGECCGYHGAGPDRRFAMQNDLDLTRRILESIRDRTDLKHRTVSIADYSPDLVGRHVERLFDDGMLDGVKQDVIGEAFARVAVRDLTTAGHNFLGALESGDTWERLKAALDPREIGALSLRELAGLAKEITLRGIRKKLGLD